MLGKAADCPQNILAYLYFSTEMSRLAGKELGKYFLLVDNMLVVLGFLSFSADFHPLCRSDGLGSADGRHCARPAPAGTAGIRHLWRRHRRPLRAKPMIVTGMLMRAGGFAAWPSPMSRGCCGSRAYSPDSAVHCSIRRGRRWWLSWCVRISAAAFSILMMQDSAGAVIGALLGAGCCSMIFAVCSAGAALLSPAPRLTRYLPAWKLSTVKTPIRGVWAGCCGQTLRHVLTLTGYYMLAVQVMLMLPIMVASPARRPP